MPRLGAAGVFAAMAGPVLTMVDSSIVNVAIADLSEQFGGQLDEVAWVSTAYLLALAVGLAATTTLSALFGRRRAYVLAVAGFTLASLLCALAPGLGWLVAARVLHGLVAAPLVPLAMTWLVTGESKNAMTPAAGLVMFAAPAFGPALGGLLVTLSWHAIFLINVPVGLAALIACRRLPAEQRSPARLSAFSPVGLVLLAAGLGSLLWVASTVNERGWTAPLELVLTACGLAACGFFLLLFGRGRGDVLDLRPLRRPRVGLSLLLVVLVTVSLYGALFLVPTFAQQAQGRSAWLVGVAMIPVGVVTGAAAVGGGVLTARLPLWMVVAGGFAVVAGASSVLLMVDQRTPLWILIVAVCGRGIGVGFVVTPLVDTVAGGASGRDAEHITTTFSMLERVAASLAVAALAAIYQRALVVGGPVEALHRATWAMTLAALIGVAVSLLLARRPGRRQGAVPARADLSPGVPT